MNIDITHDQAILLVAILDEKIPVCKPEIEYLFTTAKANILGALVGAICDKNRPQ